jgi:hypothetical protein
MGYGLEGTTGCVQAQAEACGYNYLLIPKLSLGTPLLPVKLSLATIFVPKYNLGTS